MTSPPATPIGDLSEAARGETHADLLAGSAGYQHFLQQLSRFISPDEALDTASRFKAASRLLWITIAAYLLLYLGINQLFGPLGMRIADWGNDALRAALFLAAILLIVRCRLAVAGQILLPLGSLCFLPLPITDQPDWWKGPILFGIIVLLLFVTGWCLDAASDRQAFFPILRRWLPRAALLLYVALNLAAYLWIFDSAAPPVFNLLAAIIAIPFIEFSKKPASAITDVDFLYAAAWKRWRFFISGRALAIVLGIVPFMLFANLLDYQEQLELALEPDKAPEILRMDYSPRQWEAFFWRQEGRFLTTTDFLPPKPEAAQSKIERAHERDQPLTAFYLFNADTSSYNPPVPAECAGPENDLPLPDQAEFPKLQSELLALNTHRMTREKFLEETAKFEPLRITSRCRLLRRTTAPFGLEFVAVSFQPARDGGVCFAEKPDLLVTYPSEIKHQIARNSVPKWIFFAFGILGFVFLWRRGGDSSLARWVGIWCVGASLTPSMNTSLDTLPHLTHWLWQESVLHHWNTLASAAQPLFNLFFIATTATMVLWTLQIPLAVCCTYTCWPTPVMAGYPPLVRQIVILGKIALAILLACTIFLFVFIPVAFLKIPGGSLLEFSLNLVLNTAVFLIFGWLLRIFTRHESEIPRLGPWPACAVACLTLALVFYGPIVIDFNANKPAGIPLQLGNFFGLAFVAIMSHLILKKDFLRVRAIAGFTTLILLLVVPVAVHFAEDFVPRFLASGPFFRERGAEMVSIMLVILLFPWLHRQLHELLLAVSVPRLRKIEHHVEHALEAIVDAQDDHARAHMVSELFEHLHVPQYLFLSRRPHSIFAADITKLPQPVPSTFELSEPLRDFLGRRHHFIDLQSMAYEWPFFFHQFELHRLAAAVQCRFLLPVAVGESLRALLLLPDGPGGDTIANPAVSQNINNFSIAAALSRPNR